MTASSAACGWPASVRRRAVRLHHRRPLLRPALLPGVPGRPARGRRARRRRDQDLRRRGHEGVPQPHRQTAHHDQDLSGRHRSSASSPVWSASAPRAAGSSSTPWKSTSGSTASRATSPTCSVPCTASGSWRFTSATTITASRSISPATSPWLANSTPSIGTLRSARLIDGRELPVERSFTGKTVGDSVRRRRSLNLSRRHDTHGNRSEACRARVSRIVTRDPLPSNGTET